MCPPFILARVLCVFTQVPVKPIARYLTGMDPDCFPYAGVPGISAFCDTAMVCAGSILVVVK